MDVSKSRHNHVAAVGRDNSETVVFAATALSARGVPVRALGTRARCVPVITVTGGHSRSVAVNRNGLRAGAQCCDLHRKEG
jgi:hypothetical protein